jgi:hypothetical protein
MKINVELEEDDWYEVVGYLREGHLDPIALEIDRQAGERRGGDVALEAMLLELQRKHGHVSLFVGSDNRWWLTLIIPDGIGESRTSHYGRTPLAAVVRAYRAVVNESGDKEQQR